MMIDHPELSDSSVGEVRCPICFQDMNKCNTSATACGHLFCFQCISDSLKRNDCCPICKQTSHFSTLRTIYLPGMQKTEPKNHVPWAQTMKLGNTGLFGVRS